jgi:hypothetical protein
MILFFTHLLRRGFQLIVKDNMIIFPPTQRRGPVGSREGHHIDPNVLVFPATHAEE